MSFPVFLLSLIFFLRKVFSHFSANLFFFTSSEQVRGRLVHVFVADSRKDFSVQLIGNWVL
jgi:hypothetical protein